MEVHSPSSKENGPPGIREYFALASSPAIRALASRIETSDVERLFREHNATLLQFISAKVGSEQEAREIAQEAYVHLLRLNHPEAISYLRAFLFKTAANLAIDRLRERGRRTHVTSMAEVDFAVFEVTPERQVSGEQALAVIGAAVAQLPAKCKQAFLMHRLYDLEIDEIAERMGIGACMVRRYIARGLEHVRHRLDAEGHYSFRREH
jgi:RNA polymerase sigma factor (sigma-70 family)